MKRLLAVIILLLSSTIYYSQDKPDFAEKFQVSIAEHSEKILSGKLIMDISEKLYYKEMFREESDSQKLMTDVVLYYERFPGSAELIRLEELGIIYFPETWIPALKNHPYGFLLARVPADMFIKLLESEDLKKIDSGEYLAYVCNNEAGKKIYADDAWKKGWTGSGVKVAVIDAGLDAETSNEDLPITIEKKDYSQYPVLDDNVSNTGTGHGTHVTGSVLGRGYLSYENTGNSAGAYRGMAPDADLIFLKVCADGGGSAFTSVIIAAIKAAVTEYNADVVSLSMGNWQTYHDGSSAFEQAIDWVYDQGRPFFVAAGNNAHIGKHYSGVMGANDSTGFIKINVADVYSNSLLSFNLVWNDGTYKKGLYLNYFNSSYQKLSKYDAGVTESIRGTESRYSNYSSYLPHGSSTFYVKVYNPSSSAQVFHIYENTSNYNTKFNTPDQQFTICEPATADHALAVGAYVSRKYWTSSDGTIHSLSSGEEDEIATFSSRGPRVDELQKPDIAAPGSVVISMRDRNANKSTDLYWADNDGISGGDANYYIMQGTSMACPVAAGAAALFLSKYPNATPNEIYDAIKANAISDMYTGTLPNSVWGYGKLNIYKTIENSSLPDSNISVDGEITETQYSSIASKMNSNNSFGILSDLHEMFTYADTVSDQLYIGITGRIDSSSGNGIGIWLNSSELSGMVAGTSLGGSPGSHYMTGAGGADYKADFDVDYMFAVYPDSNVKLYVDVVKVAGLRAFESLGNCGLKGNAGMNRGKDLFSTNSVSFAFNNDGRSASGLEMRIPFSELGVTDAGNIQAFAFLISNNGSFSDVTLPGNISTGAPGYSANFFTMAGGPYHSDESALPVELVSFNAIINSSSITLNWETESEICNFGFEIERAGINSQPGVLSYEKIGFIRGAGNSYLPKSYLYVDENLKSGKYVYRLKQIDNNGQWKYSNCIEAQLTSAKLDRYELKQNFPNPFNSLTRIEYSVPEISRVKLEVFDVLGRLAAVLENSVKEAGNYITVFEADKLASGIYIYKLSTENFIIVKKMNLLK